MYNRIQKPIETVPGIPLMYVDDLEDTSDFIPTFQSELRKEIVSAEMEYNNSQSGVAALLEKWHGHFGMLRRELRKTHPRALLTVVPRTLQFPTTLETIPKFCRPKHPWNVSGNANGACIAGCSNENVPSAIPH